MSKTNLIKRFFSTVKTHKLTLGLFALLLAQQLFIWQKNQAIEILESQNAALEDDVVGIQDQLSDLENGASNIRKFQSEMVGILKSINHNYPVRFVSDKNEQRVSSSKKLDIREQVKNAYQKIFKLSSSQETLQKENADLLASAIFIKRMQNELPNIFPVEGRISSNFGDRIHPITKTKRPHRGVDFAASIGKKVVSTADGKVKRAGYMRDLGYFVEIEHANGFTTRYGHLSKIHVKKGDNIKKQQQIGSVGNTGSSCDGAHLHYEISWYGIHQNPVNYLSSFANSPAQIL